MKILAASLLALVTVVAVASAQPGPTQRTAASIECSRQADAKGLHGKPRKKFRSSCLRAAKRAGKS